MWQQGSVPNEEWFVVFLRFIDEIGNRLHGFPTDFEASIAVTAAVGHAMGEAAVFEMALPPFSGLEGIVTLFGEERGKQVMLC